MATSTDKDTDEKYQRTEANRPHAKETRRKNNESHYSHHVEGGEGRTLILSQLFPKKGQIKNIVMRAVGVKEDGVKIKLNYIAPDGGGMSVVFDLKEGINTFDPIAVKEHGLINLEWATEESKFNVNDIHIAYIFSTNQ